MKAHILYVCGICDRAYTEKNNGEKIVLHGNLLTKCEYCDCEGNWKFVLMNVLLFIIPFLIMFGIRSCNTP